MVKLNLLDLPNNEGQTQTIEPKRPIEESRHSEIDFSFFQPDDDQSTIQVGVPEPPPPQPAPELQDDSTIQQNPFAIQDNFQNEYPADSTGFESTAPRAWIPWTFGILFLLGLVGFGGWWWMNNSSSIPTRRSPIATPSETPPISSEDPLANNNASDPGSTNNNATPANNTPDPAPANTNNNRPANFGNDVQQQIARNNGENQYHLNFANQFLGISSPNTAYSLLVVTPGHVYLSVLGDTRDDIAVFRTKVKENARLASLQLKTEKAEMVLVDGEQKFLNDLSIEIATRNAAPIAAAGGQLAANNVRTTLRQLSDKHRLTTTYFQQGESTRNGRFRTINFYTKVSGSQSAVLSYLGEMARLHPSMRINKISIYPASGSTLNNGRVESRIEVTLFDAS